MSIDHATARHFGVVSGACLPQDGCDHPDLEETQSVHQRSQDLPLHFESTISEQRDREGG